MRSALFQFFIIKAMTIENIENHMAYTCQCGGVNFALLKSGAIECNRCSTPLDDVKWWAGGMGAQLARAIKAEAERDALKAAMPVGELTEMLRKFEEYVGRKSVLHASHMGKAMSDADYETFTRLRDRKIPELRNAILAAASTQSVREPLQYCRECMRPMQNNGTCTHGIK